MALIDVDEASAGDVEALVVVVWGRVTARDCCASTLCKRGDGKRIKRRGQGRATVCAWRGLGGARRGPSNYLWSARERV